MTNTSIESLTESVRRVNHQKFQTGPGQIHVCVDMEDMSPALSATIEGTNYRIGDYAEKSLLRLVGVSRKFIDIGADDCDLLASAINNALAGASTRDQKAGIHVSTADGVVQSFSPASLAADVPPCLGEIWGLLKEEMGSDFGTGELVDLGRGEYDLRLTVNNRNAEPASRVGDITQSGVLVHLNGKVTTTPFTNRLECTNGMTSTEKGQILVMGRDDNDSIQGMFREGLRAATEFNTRIQRTDDQILPNIHTYVTQALKIAGSSSSLRGMVNDAIENEAPNKSLWEALQIVTRIAREYASDRPRKRNQIEAVAGTVVNMQGGGGRCSTCNSQVGSDVIE